MIINIIMGGKTDGKNVVYDKDGNEAFYVMNYFDNGDSEMEEDCSIFLRFDGMKKVALYGTQKCLNGLELDVKDNVFGCDLQPGEGMLVIPYCK